MGLFLMKSPRKIHSMDIIGAVSESYVLSWCHSFHFSEALKYVAGQLGNSETQLLTLEGG